MKNVIILVLLSAISMAETASVTKVKSLTVCQSYIDQAKAYKATMGEDKVSQMTLEFYKEKILVHCGNMVSKVKFEKKYFSEMMMKAENNSVPECKMAIEMASKYSENKKQSAIIVAAHRENIADNCGTLVASHVSAYCLYGDKK